MCVCASMYVNVSMYVHFLLWLNVWEYKDMCIFECDWLWRNMSVCIVGLIVVGSKGYIQREGARGSVCMGICEKAEKVECDWGGKGSNRGKWYETYSRIVEHRIGAEVRQCQVATTNFSTTSSNHVVAPSFSHFSMLLHVKQQMNVCLLPHPLPSLFIWKSPWTGFRGKLGKSKHLEVNLQAILCGMYLPRGLWVFLFNVLLNLRRHGCCLVDWALDLWKCGTTSLNIVASSNFHLYNSKFAKQSFWLVSCMYC